MLRKSILAVVGLVALVLLSSGAVSAQPFSYEQNFDRPGSDYVVFDSLNANSCSASCRGDSKCRAWTYVTPGVQGPRARCYLKNRVPVPRPSTCCTSGTINLLREIQGCRRIGHIQGQGRVTCIDPGGRQLIRGSKAFDENVEMFILVRFYRLPVGNHNVTISYERKTSNGRYASVAYKKAAFKSESEEWAYWFPAHFNTAGYWRASIMLTDIAGFDNFILGDVSYRIGWGGEEG